MLSSSLPPPPGHVPFPPAARGAPIERRATKRPARVFVTRRIPEAGLRLLRRAGVRVEVGQHEESRELDRELLIAGIRRCDALLCLLTDHLDREALETNGGLLGVAQMAVGFDNIDLPAATDLGLPVSNTPGVLTETTADFTWALLMAVARR
ncbi:MAG: hypothetical protein MI919_30310, partial [Holophagales bacterium]|nr:hypothetical protein [Holophagales bacterium]